MTDTNQEKGWKDRFDEKFGRAGFRRNNVDWVVCAPEIKTFITTEIHTARQEERQFILNILDGIDIVDKEMGNKSGGTKAIRFALECRII